MKRIIAVATLSLVMTGSIIETASAKSRHHRHQAQRIVAMPDTPSILSFFQNAAREAIKAPVRVLGATGRSFSGIASFYGNEAGNKTASGARFNQNAMTAAHRTLPFGTKLRVTHGDRSVVVTVNDRGPFIKGRVLDLSKGAASTIGLTGRGVGHVVAEVM